MEQAPPDPSQPAAQANDAFFKAVYSDPEHATAFFKSHLSPSLAAAIDWSTLTVAPGSFVQTDLHQTHSDLLFSVKIGRYETLLHLLFEHQSNPNRAMRLRLLGYMLELFNRYDEAGEWPPPPVLSFVLHQGPDAWNFSTAFEDLFELPPELLELLLPFLPKFHHGLLDLSRYDPASEEKEYSQRAILHLMKLVRDKEIESFLRWFAETLAGQLPEGLVAWMLRYIVNTEGGIDLEKIYRNISADPELQKQAMTVAEQLLAKGRQEGKWIGKIQTLQEILGKPQSSSEELGKLSDEKLEALHSALRRECEGRFRPS